MTVPPSEPRQELPSTYVVQNRSNPQEIQRLHLQDKLVTVALGGVLTEQPDPTRFSQVLDVACGTGGWLTTVAKTVPSISHLVGVDISRHIVEAARAEAEARQVQDRVTFHVMDILRPLTFEKNTFDLTNLRFAASFLRTWEWPQALNELLRVTQPGGIIRLTEADLPDHSSSPALLRLFRLLDQAYNRAGKYFRPQSNGVAGDLAGLLKQQGLQQVQTRIYQPEIRSGTVEGQLFFDDMKYLFKTNEPFLRKWSTVPPDYRVLCHKMLEEMQQPDFVVSNQTITAWGIKADTETIDPGSPNA